MNTFGLHRDALVMTKRLVFLCLLARLAQTQTAAVTSVTYDSLSHSVVRIDFQTSGRFTQGHIRYIDITAKPGGVCTDGASGVVQPNSYNPPAGPTYGSYQMVVGGLNPGHTYSFCPEISNTNNGVYSRGGPFLTVTMPALPTAHPALPIPPATFPTGYPSDMGSYQTLTMGKDCANLVACLGKAINKQLSNGTVISLPAGVPASSIGGIGPFGGEGVFPVAPDVVNFSSSDVSTSANTIRSKAHGFTEGSQAVFGVSYGCLPGDNTANPSNCKGAGNNNPIPFPRGVPLYVHVVDANTFQLYFGASKAKGGTPITFADAGSGTMRYVKYPRALHYIVVRTSTPDSQFVPLGSLLQGPPDGTGIPTRPIQWVSKMGNLQLSPAATAPLIYLGDPNTDPMTANIRFEGIHFSYTDTTEPAVSGDPTTGAGFFTTDLNTENVTWDRCYFDTPGSPFRTGIVFSWNGLNNGFLGNYVASMEAWHQTAAGLAVRGSGDRVTIGSGVTHYGAGTGTLSNNAKITLTGSPEKGQQRMFLDFSMSGTLNIVPPPGVTATVSGISNYHVVSLMGLGAGAGPALNSVGTTSAALPTSQAVDNYYADPVVSPSASCTTTTSLFSSLPMNSPPSFASAGAGNFGIQFTSDANQYLCGVRVYKHPKDTETSHTVGAWTTAGAQLATASTPSETASGWQTALFPTPVPIKAATTYKVGYHTSVGWPFTNGQFQNTDYYNANMHVSGAYVSSNGSGSYGDTWPKDYMGNPAVGILGYADIGASGAIVGAGNAAIGTTQQAGGNGMIGGVGPGPWMMIGNFISGAGLPWHFDNSGSRWAMRGDYTLLRNYHYGPRYTFFGTASSDGMDYTWRQPLEWKGGNRIRIYGDIFDGSMFEGGSKAMIALQSPGEVNCVTDADVMYNTFKHGPGTLGGGIEYGGGWPMSCPPVRTRYAQNMSWDISGAYGVGGNGTGWWLSGQIGAEDVIIDHNTDIGRSGGKPVWWDQSEFHIEGVQVSNNLLQIDPQYGGLEEDSSAYQTRDACAGLIAKAMADCKWTPSYAMTHNVLLPLNGSTQRQIKSLFPSLLVNYIASNTSITGQGLFPAQGGYSLSTPDPDLHLKSLSSYCAGCGSGVADQGGVGADVDKVLAEQGQVILSSTNATGTTAASITVTQPDSGTCTVDYGTEPTVTTFKRVSQACTPGPITFNLSGLTTGTLYYFRYDGAVQQPMGQFKTH